MFGGRGDTATYVSKIREAFSQGKPVIANVKPSPAGNNLYTSYGHYIVLLGEDQNGTVLVSDPNGRGVDNIKNKYTPGLEELVRLYLTEEIAGDCSVGGILIPDQVPTGVSFNKKLEGFEAGLEVITPGQAEVINIEGNSITLKFTAENKSKNMTMKIEGISINPDIAEGDQLQSKQPIGTTTDDDIKILMRDQKKAIINNVEDYMVVNSKNILSVSQPYNFTQDDVELIAKLIAHEMRPSVLVSAYGMNEEDAMEAGKVCGYVLVNRALVNYSGNGTTLLEQLCAPGQYAGANTLQEWASVEITPDVMEAAEWISKYDCSSVLNPRGEPMTRNILGQSGWCQCKPNGVPGSTCWWWIDTTQDGQVTEANSRGDPPYDSFYCKNSDYPEK